MNKALTKTDYAFRGQKGVYHGKVRDVYNIDDKKLVMVATDRISAFDVILPEGIPYKGQVLNQIAAKFLDATTDICPNWKLATPDPMVTVGVMCKGFPVEMIVRGYLCGSAWRAYKSGVREICGVKLPEGSADLCAENFMKLAPETVNSLYRDLSSGKPPQKTELDHLIGRMIEMGRAANIPTPYHEMAYKRFAPEKR